MLMCNFLNSGNQVGMNTYFTNQKCNIANFYLISIFISLGQKSVCVCERERERAREITNYEYFLYRCITVV